MGDDLHRQFGVETNNETWRLLDAGPPGSDATQDERDRFLYRAYASAYHWMETPTATVANRARGEHLVARAAIAVGLPEIGIRHARRCLELCEEHRGDVEDWDFAFAEEAIARSLAASGAVESAAQHRAKAAELGAAIQDQDDREVFLAELKRGPWFGLE
jgi:hypothetical protein